MFCLDADNLDGTIVELDDVTAAIDAVAEAGLSRVVLSGGEPSLSRHLLAAIARLAPKVVIFTHGEQGAAAWMRQAIRHRHPDTTVILPKQGKGIAI